VGSLNNGTMRIGWICGQLAGIELEFWVGIFGRRVQRRGGRVNIPEIGSRVGLFVFGGI
jgi:hypothetical protein